MELSEVVERLKEMESIQREFMQLFTEALVAVNNRLYDIEDIIADEFREAYGQMKRGEGEEVGFGSSPLDFVHEGQEEPASAPGTSKEPA